jgi:ABC-type nitrate/sulfonate/bicarbonate transport system ATPase subunit
MEVRMDDWLRLVALCVGYRGMPVSGPFSLSLPGSEPICAIVGRSGVGKTTLLHTLGGHLPAVSGSVDVLGVPPDYRRGDLPIVFQHYGLFPWMSAIGNVEFALKCQGVKRGDRRARALELLAMMEVADAADQPVSVLSGGMSQRVSLARALGANPKCLLMDEPFSALDAATKHTITRRLQDVLARLGVFAVLVTHSLDDAMNFAQNIVVVRPGTSPLLLNRNYWRQAERSETLAMLQFELDQSR